MFTPPAARSQKQQGRTLGYRDSELISLCQGSNAKADVASCSMQNDRMPFNDGISSKRSRHDGKSLYCCSHEHIVRYIVILIFHH